MKLTRYEIEYETNAIIDDIANDYDIDNDFYGDCKPREVTELENRIELESDEEERSYLFSQIREILEEYAKSYNQEEE